MTEPEAEVPHLDVFAGLASASAGVPEAEVDEPRLPVVTHTYGGDNGVD